MNHIGRHWRTEPVGSKRNGPRYWRSLWCNVVWYILIKYKIIINKTLLKNYIKTTSIIDILSFLEKVKISDYIGFSEHSLRPNPYWHLYLYHSKGSLKKKSPKFSFVSSLSQMNVKERTQNLETPLGCHHRLLTKVSFNPGVHEVDVREP